jgi:hypothetical protein
MLYLMFPKQLNGKTILVITSRESFVNTTMSGPLFKKQQEPQKPREEPQIQNRIISKSRESTHYYDPRKGRMVKKWRF